MILQGASASYEVHEQVGENANFRYYRASSDAQPGRELMLKIGTMVAQNGLLDREAFLLRKFVEGAQVLEDEFHRQRGRAGGLYYEIGFPTVVETFVSQEQGARRVLVLRFEASDTLERLAPLRFIRERDRVRVDPKTSAWIMGKLLKIIAFAHLQRVKVNNLTEDNILIVRDAHLVTILDWSVAIYSGDDLTDDEARWDVRDAAAEVVKLLGGDPTTGSIPDHEQLSGNGYAAMLASLVRGDYINAFQAHSAFYREVEAHWGRTYHPYTTLPL